MISDDKYITCSVCMETMRNLYEIAAAFRESAPYKTLKEDAIEHIIRNVCNPDKKEGRWIRMQDIVEVKDSFSSSMRLKLVQPGGEMACKEECKSIRRSCEKLLLFEDEEEDNGFDMEQLVVYLYKDKGKEEGEDGVEGEGGFEALQKAVCRKRCGDGTPKLLLPEGYQRVDFPFVAKSERMGEEM